MPLVRARISSKGQVTLPVELRRNLELRPGDQVMFQLEDSSARLLPLRRRRLTEFSGILRTTRPYKGLKEMRRELARKLGTELDRRAREILERERRRRRR